MSTVYHNDLLSPYLALPQGDKVQAECKLSALLCLWRISNTSVDVWIDGDGGLRSKTTVCLLLLRVFMLLTLCPDRQQEGHRYWPTSHLGL
jgi:hypothetical protein